ncbi:DNA polymerase III subunit beta [Fundidesulfovibrio soli]|uniref:DNA polymerase III subunit beta n=1 Tax=Fundidesulfovibrio soli TaxID=2922716 RepID=UPI001FAF307A|nr:DNA polymerase III subunit beta [Fundidesulfovibrio soli]
MFVKVTRTDIIEGLQKSANIIPAKTGAAFLRTIWLSAENGALRIMSTDSSLEFVGSYRAEVVEQGLCGVQGRSFFDLVRKLPGGEIQLKLDPTGQTLLVSQSGRNYKLPTSEKSWFQPFAEFPQGEHVMWSGDFLQELIDRVFFCVSDEDTMEAMACMYMRAVDEKVEVCGLNGHQFAMCGFVNDDVRGMLPPEGVLIQKKYVLELKKWLTADEIELAISQKRLFFRTQDQRETFSLPLSYFQYPDYKSFVGKLSTPGVSELQAEKGALSEALDRISIFNTDNNRCTYFQLETPGQLTLQSQGNDTGAATESMEAGFAGELKKIAFPTRDLLEILGHFHSPKVRFTLTGAEGPCGITGEDDADYLVIIMPMKIVEETYYSEEASA